MKNLLLRALTGIVYVSVIVGCVWFSEYSFLALICLITILCSCEFYGLIKTAKNIPVNKYIGCIGSLYLSVASYLFASNTSGYIIYLPYLLYVFIVFVYGLYIKKGDPLVRWAYTFLGQVYIALPVSLLNLIAFSPDIQGNINYNPILILALFIFIWVNDTGAYLIGITCGKHRLFERISPKKSWEGFFGGLIFTILSSLVFAHFEPRISTSNWMIMATVVVVFGTWGDLVESLIKRTLNIKDSGNALPGHGGFLDRFDSLLLAVYGILFMTELLY